MVLLYEGVSSVDASACVHFIDEKLWAQQRSLCPRQATISTAPGNLLILLSPCKHSHTAKNISPKYSFLNHIVCCILRFSSSACSHIAFVSYFSIFSPPHFSVKCPTLDWFDSWPAFNFFFFFFYSVWQPQNLGPFFRCFCKNTLGELNNSQQRRLKISSHCKKFGWSQKYSQALCIYDSASRRWCEMTLLFRSDAPLRLRDYLWRRLLF